MDNEWKEYRNLGGNDIDYLLDLIMDNKIVYLSENVFGSAIYYMSHNRVVPFWIKKESHVARPVEYTDLLELSVVYTHQTIEIEGE